ncbi:MAG: trimeric intracellular cation channel family protein [Hyphomicrobiaceae bacterium]
MIDTLVQLFDWLGVAVFAATGALAAARKQMDIVGFALLATATGVGGGTLRDVALGMLPVFWVGQPVYLAICIGVAVTTFAAAGALQSRLNALLWLDAMGLALFAVTGAKAALDTGAGGLVAIVMGVVTATFGGIIRDLLAGDVPVVLSREIYVSAALLGAVVLVTGTSIGVPVTGALAVGFLAALLLRAAALHWGWSLPRYGDNRQQP